MKRALMFGSLVFLCVGLLPAQFSLKATGGWSYASAGDFAKARQSYIDILKTYTVPYSSHFGSVHTGFNFGLEALYSLNQTLSLGLGVGYMKFPYEATIDVPLFSFAQTNNCGLAVVPITLNLHKSFPLASRIEFVLTGGAGLYLTTFDFQVLFDYSPGESFERTFRATRAALGLHGGVGIVAKLNDRLSLSAEVIGRYAQASDFKGVWTETEISGGKTIQHSGSDRYFYYYEYIENGLRLSNLNFSQTGPSNAALVRKGIVDLSGVAVNVGVKYSFGK